MDRDTFLQTVRIATATADPADAIAYEPGPLVVDLPPAELEEEFTASLQRVDGVVHRADQPDEVPGMVVGILQQHAATSFVTWDELPVPGVIDAVSSLQLRRIPTGVPHDADERRRRQLGFLDLTAGITGADAGLSVSGTIVLTAGNGRPRMASLIPMVHIALLNMSLMFRSISHFAAAHPTAAATTSNLIFITGPSRTGDIEMKLNLGVHGPKHLHVVLF